MSSDYTQVLDLIKAGDWNRAHDIVQSRSDTKACLIHAYLHRVEGDLSNALYWYRRAGATPSNLTLEDEMNRLYKTV